MGKYVTVSQMRLTAPGLYEIDGTPAQRLPDISLAQYINRSEKSVDSYASFDLKQAGGFEPHTITVFQTQFDYQTRRVAFACPPVPMRRVLSERIVISTTSPSGVPLTATMSPADCVINNYDFYVELVPLTAITYAVAPVIAQLGLTVPLNQMDAEFGFYLFQFGDTLYDMGDHQTFQASRGFWASTYVQALQNQPQSGTVPIPAVVYSNGAIQSGNYTLNLTEGQVIFNAPLSNPIPSITADYVYVIPDNVKLATTSQVEWLIGQRRLNLMGLQGVEFVRDGQQQIKRHLRSSGGVGTLDEEPLCPEAQRHLAGYRSIPIA